MAAKWFNSLDTNSRFWWNMDFLDLNTCSRTSNCRCPWWTQANQVWMQCWVCTHAIRIKHTYALKCSREASRRGPPSIRYHSRFFCNSWAWNHFLKSVHFKNTVARSSVLSKLWSFSIIYQLTLFWFQLMYHWKLSG